MRAGRSDTRSLGCAFLITGLFVLAAVAAVIFGIANATHIEHRTCSVADKDRTTKSDGNSDARVYTKDCGVLRVADSLFSGTWHSADTYAAIQPGHRYRFTTRGYRIPLFSMFPNIVRVEEVPS